MSGACPIPTSAERRYIEIQRNIEKGMMQKIHAALQEATELARTEMQDAGLDMTLPSSEYFISIIHQRMFCILCKADPDTFQGGRADIAIAIIRNNQNIARHHWKADIEPCPKTQSSQLASISNAFSPS